MEKEKEALPTAPLPAAERLKITGSWSGVLEVQLDSWTLPLLRSEVAERSGGSPDCINLICRGKVLRDDEGAVLPLLELGLKNNSKVFAIAVSPDHRKALDEEEAGRARHLDRIWNSIHALVESCENEHVSYSTTCFNMETDDQICPNSLEVKYESETDQRDLLMGLMLHQYAKTHIRRKQYKAALDLLSMAVEALSLCNPNVTKMILNVLVLEVDTVWCYFMLRDISWLSEAGIRLAKVRQELGYTYGKGSIQFRPLHAGVREELAMRYMRLELLEGVVAYHSGNFEESRKALTSAQAKYAELQVPDEALSSPMTGQEDIERRDAIMEQVIYEKTPQEKAVDLERLNELVSIGFERDLAAEALQLNENDTKNALDDLTDPEKNFDLQHQIELRKKLKAPGPTDVDIRESMAIGYDGSAASRSNQQADSNPPTHDREFSSEAAAAAATDSRGVAAMEDEELDGAIDLDIGVTTEGDAIAEYLALLDSPADELKGSCR